jgi:hypothetical protein
MAIAQRLKECHDYALQIRERIDSLRATEGLFTHLGEPMTEALERVYAKSLEAIEAASSPVKIGLVGEFNAGKTLLLGSLIGYGDGLPVQPYPTTGNITWLRFRPVEELQTTRFVQYRIEYLSLKGIEDCLEEMLVAARSRGTAAGLDANLLQELQRFQARDPGVWNPLLDWCKNTWQRSHNVLLRLLIRELVAFARAYLSCGLFCKKPSVYLLAPEIASVGLSLPAMAGDIQQLGFEELPAALPAMTELPETLTEIHLQITFPLIKRIEIEVEISRKIWDISGMGLSTEFVLLDFPGLGAADSGVRDTYLCRRELNDVQTVLILLNSINPGGIEGANFFNLLQSDRPGVNLRDQILVGLGRFDQLPLGAAGENKLLEMTADLEEIGGALAEDALDILDVLDDKPIIKLTEAELFKQLRVLKTSIDGALNLATEPKKIFLLSPMLALAKLSERFNAIRVGSDGFVENLPADSEPARKFAKLWGKIAEKLKQHDPKSHMLPWLTDFVLDGGVGVLRERLSKHVEEFGLQQLFDHVRRKVDALARELARFAALVPPREPEKPVVVEVPLVPAEILQRLRRILGELTRKYTNLIFKLTNNPPELEVERDGVLVGVNQVVESECIYQVCEWNEWNSLFENSHNNRLVEHSADWTQDVFNATKGADAPGGDWVGNVFGASTAPPPTKSDDFHQPFENTVKQLETFSLQVATEAIHARMERVASELVAERDDLSFALNNRDLPGKVQARYGQAGSVLFAVMSKSLKPEELAPPILNRAQLTTDTYQSLEVARLFPLPKRTFAWASSIANLPANLRPEEKHSHLIKAPMLRDAFIEAIQKAMAQIVSEATKKANQASLELFRSIHERLRQLINNDRLLNTLAEESVPPTPEKTEPPPPKWEMPETVRELAAIPSPLDVK